MDNSLRVFTELIRSCLYPIISYRFYIQYIFAGSLVPNFVQLDFDYSDEIQERRINIEANKG